MEKEFEETASRPEGTTEAEVEGGDSQQEAPSASAGEKKPLFTMRELLEAGVHFGHRTMRWNAKMAPYIYGIRNKIHIIDLTQTAILMTESMRILKEMVRKRGKVLFVCTKKQGAASVRNLAEEVGQFHVTHKWLGGMLTNWKTVSQSIKKIKVIENQLADESSKIPKKEQVVLGKILEKLTNNLNGIRTMGGLPDLLFVFDILKESLAVNEARALGIPIMAIVDTNSNPELVDYPIPGNDDSIKAIELYCRVMGDVLRDIKLPKPRPDLTTRRSPARGARSGGTRGPGGDEEGSRAGAARETAASPVGATAGAGKYRGFDEFLAKGADER
ncbi:MAG: 30S ribosomal protein S2 [Rickettsiales bacterium]|jgi:small subunit ribosomal protein S2|nr:30S ribosomal protein S2 [Rickettsiales bacterium]